MPGYVSKAMKRFGITDNHPKSNAPGPHLQIRYGKQEQRAIEDTSPKIADDRIKRIQQILGVFLYYGRDCTLLCPVNKLASRLADPTDTLERDTHQLLHYAATWPDATIVLKPSDMKL